VILEILERHGFIAYARHQTGFGNRIRIKYGI
jgi:hypothetical protein